jgi:hypothetical protein
MEILVSAVGLIASVVVLRFVFSKPGFRKHMREVQRELQDPPDGPGPSAAAVVVPSERRNTDNDRRD